VTVVVPSGNTLPDALSQLGRGSLLA